MKFGARRSLKGRVVAITGGANGLGAALSWAFAETGARIALLDIDEPGLDKQAGALSDAGHEVFHQVCDITCPSACNEAVDAVGRDLGPIEVLVNNAGISHRSLFEVTEINVIRRVMEVNFFGAVNMTQAALPNLIEHRGAVVAISSVAGFAPLIGRTGYSASKHALHGFFDSLRSEIETKGTHVMLVCPAFIDTGIAAKALSGRGDRGNKQQAVIGKQASPETVAKWIVDGLERERETLVLTNVGKASYWISRLAPRVYRSIMTRKQGAEFAS